MPKHAVTTDAMGGSQTLDIPAGEVVRTDGYTPFKTPVKDAASGRATATIAGRAGCLERSIRMARPRSSAALVVTSGGHLVCCFADDVTILPAGSYVINWRQLAAGLFDSVRPSQGWRWRPRKSTRCRTRGWLMPMKLKTDTGGSCSMTARAAKSTNNQWLTVRQDVEQGCGRFPQPACIDPTSAGFHLTP